MWTFFDAQVFIAYYSFLFPSNSIHSFKVYFISCTNGIHVYLFFFVDFAHFLNQELSLSPHISNKQVCLEFTKVVFQII